VTYRIPFNRPTRASADLSYVREALGSGHLSGDGPFARRCQAVLEDALGVPRVLLTTSCTHALEMAALLLDIKPGDEIVVPSFTFVSTVNAFVLRGARPVFVDIRPDTLNIDERGIEAALTPRTRAIVVVHYAGVGCDMDTIGSIARRAGLPIVEDNAHGLFGRYRGRSLGTFGCLATLSFHETKNLSCGEGGALLINDPAFVERAEMIREKGTDRSRFFRGEVDKYNWTDVGSSYVPSDLVAALLAAQLEDRVRIQARRRQLWERYRENLAQWAAEISAVAPAVPSDCESSYHMFHVLMPSLDARTALINSLKEQGILAVFHYLPLHSSPMARSIGADRRSCPVTERVSHRLVRLPFFTDMTDDEQTDVIAAVRAFRPEPVPSAPFGQGRGS
jgi:dTDP-4-amino-4,6-dideoxygalactose transaminase